MSRTQEHRAYSCGHNDSEADFSLAVDDIPVSATRTEVDTTRQSIPELEASLPVCPPPTAHALNTSADIDFEPHCDHDLKGYCNITEPM